MSEIPQWASESFWKKVAVWVTSGSFIIPVALTFDTLKQTSAGSDRVPAYSVINKKIDYQFDEELRKFMPIIGEEELLFGQTFSEEEAEQMVTLGKKTTQSKNCMNCHTLLGNGAYYAPDLTKAWLGQGWLTTGLREEQMLKFLMDPEKNAWRWKWSLILLNAGVLGMTIALLVAGYEQSFIERAVGGSTWAGYFDAQTHPSFISSMNWRMFFGWVTAAGLGLLVWDLLTIGKGETRKAEVIVQQE